MNRFFLYLFTLLPMITLFSCVEEEPEIPTPKFTFAEEVIPGYEDVAITCTVSGNVSVDKLSIEYSKDQNLANAKKAAFTKGFDKFTIIISGLEAECTYYYRYIVENNISGSIIDDKVRSVTTACVQVSSVTLDKDSASLLIGESVVLMATINPQNASDKSVIWESDNASVATVDASGEVIAIGVGSTTITVTTIDGGFTATCIVNVSEKISSYLTFTSKETTTISLTNNGGNTPVLYISYDKKNWNKWNYSGITFSTDSPLYMYGDNPDGFSKKWDCYSTFVATGSEFSVDGSIMSLLNKDGSTSLSSLCFYYLFNECTLLESAPTLPATILSPGCYAFMFAGCTSLVDPPSLPATTLSGECYHAMFAGCTSLKKAPSLPATTLSHHCYFFMFSGCSNLSTGPFLPATTLSDACYSGMFSGCAKLVNVRPLPATNLAPHCYEQMFEGCTGLSRAPSLPATTLAKGCYYRMFSCCESLEKAPDLPATILDEYCYYSMFEGCHRLQYVKCLATDNNAARCTESWLNGVNSTGTFIADANCDWSRDESGIPEGWTVCRIIDFEEDKWEALIDNPQYGGPLTYGSYNNSSFTWSGAESYSWFDTNTKLCFDGFPDSWGSRCFGSGGEVISNYVSTSYTGADYLRQLEVPVAPSSGTIFAVHYGSKEPTSDAHISINDVPRIRFYDGSEHIIKSIDICITNYVLNSCVNGDGYFGPLTGDSYLAVKAVGFNADGQATKAATVKIITGNDAEAYKAGIKKPMWKTWDLSEMGAVNSIVFCVTGSPDCYGEYGFNAPAYFAYDNIVIED